jgi:hypothetical protein
MRYSHYDSVIHLLGDIVLKKIKKLYYEKKLEKERERLGKMLDATMDVPIAMNEEILEQSRRVDELVMRVQGEKGKGS